MIETAGAESNCKGGDKCNKLGYCIIRHAKYKVELAEREKAYRMKEDFIGHLIPLIVAKDPINHIGEYSRQHLQMALDAYHQQDYETAILHCKAVIQENGFGVIAYLCIAVSEYYQGNYEEASYYADRCSSCYDFRVKSIELFSLHCINLYKERALAIVMPGSISRSLNKKQHIANIEQCYTA